MISKRYSIAPQVINETIDGEAVMINMATGNYYSLDQAGVEVWNLVEQSADVDAIADRLAVAHDVGREVVVADLERLFTELAAEGLVVAAGDVGVTPVLPPVAVAESPTPYRAPSLEKFTDMQDLILLDPVHEVDDRGWPHLPGASVSGD